MFKKFERTEYPPVENTMVWDGECGFCKYWITHWQQLTEASITYKTYQEVASNFPDIPLKEFKKASRLIETDGSVFSGPDSAFRSFTHSKKSNIWHSWYHKYRWFQKACDHSYNHIAKNRSFYYRLTVLAFGRNPKKLRPYWLIYLFIVIAIAVSISLIL
ncbi:DCC1-like thiol-disulfide oxidoreductase family protein [Luteirhabdus pelagi]|uniref:DCC1-like thiol-disulfide oxidoreductase family protein n=1 Tax=Luteirhabdus pelagi TaxID=2792783 RepID=UPI001939AAAA|nr:DCC1-like thiol-disulfide oxidoreductase family protein [Luteirhabdus pelagi]